MNCWNQEEYIGFGLAAHSYVDGIRFCNISNLEEYIENINKGDFYKNIEVEERQTKEDKQKEFMILGFRKREGVNISIFKEKYQEKHRNFLFCSRFYF